MSLTIKDVTSHLENVRLHKTSSHKKYKKAPLSERRAARQAFERVRRAPLGSGARFAAVARSAHAGGARKFAQLAARGRRRG